MSATSHSSQDSSAQAPSKLNSWIKAGGAAVFTVGSYLGLRSLWSGFSSAPVSREGEGVAEPSSNQLQESGALTVAQPTSKSLVSQGRAGQPIRALQRKIQDSSAPSSAPSSSSFAQVLSSFTPMKIDDALEELESPAEPTPQAPLAEFMASPKAMQRRLLSTSSSIPDQVIQEGQLWDFDVSPYFGNRSLLVGSSPSWASLQYQQLAAIPTSGSAYSVRTQGSKAFTAEGNGWGIYDISSFSQLSFTPVAGATTYNVGISSDGSMVAAASDIVVPIYSLQGSSPQLLGSYSPSLGSSARDVDLSDDKSVMYVAAGSGGVDLVSVGSSPAKLDNYPVGSGYAMALARSGSDLYVATFSTGLTRLRINGSTLQFVSSLSAGSGKGRSVAFSSPYVLFSGQSAGLQVIDPSIPAMQVVATVPTGPGGSTTGAAKQGSILFTAENSAGVQIKDAKTLSAPQSLASIATSGTTWSVILDDNEHVWVANDVGGIKVYDPSKGSFIGQAPSVIGKQDSFAVAAWDFASGVSAEESFEVTLDDLPSLGPATIPARTLYPNPLDFSYAPR